jgi:hypothetical protein
MGPGRQIAQSGGFDVAGKKAVIAGSGKEKISFTTMPE